MKTSSLVDLRSSLNRTHHARGFCCMLAKVSTLSKKVRRRIAFFTVSAFLVPFLSVPAVLHPGVSLSLELEVPGSLHF